MKLHTFEPSVDYHELVDIIQKRHSVNIDDYAGMFSEEQGEKEKKHRSDWLIANGYDADDVCLDVQPDGKGDWPKDSPEMARRIKINTEYRIAEKELEKDKPPYLNYWHTICDYVSRGGITPIYIGDVDPQTEDEDDHTPIPEKYQNWISEIHKMMRDEVKGSPAYDEDEEYLNCYIDW